MTRILKAARILLSGLLIVYVTYIGIKNIFRYNSFRLEYQKQSTLYSQELLKFKQLQHELNNLNSQHYWEQLIKQRLLYTKKDEHVVKIIGKPYGD